MLQRFWIMTKLVVLLPCLAFGQFRGKVVEINSDNDTTVIPGALVYWLNGKEVAVSDANGDFKLKETNPSSRIIIKALGYAQDTLPVQVSKRYYLFILRSNAGLNEVEVVYYSSGTEVSYLNPIKTEILNERALMKAACCNLSESFETNPSIDVNFADAISGTKQIQMLGLSGQYAQISKENMPYLRGLANNYGLTFIPGTWIQSIQLSKGAGSVVNGYESFTGQINTELQKPDASDKLNFNAYVNENARNEYNLNLSRRINQRFATGLLGHVSVNPLVQDLNKDGFADIPTGSQYNVMNKYSYQHPKSGFEAQFGGGILKDVRDGGQFSSIRLSDADTLPFYKIGIQNNKWEVYSKTGLVFKKRPGSSVGLQLSYLDHDQRNRYGMNTYSGLQRTFYANLIYQGILSTTNHSYKVGSSFMNDEVHETFNARRYGRIESVQGVFVEYAYNYKETFNLVAGFRADYHNYYGLFYTPRLHLRYAIRPNSILRLSAGKALRTASVFSDNSYLMVSSRTWNIKASDANRPYGLDPEVGYNYGLNYTYRFKINYRDASVSLDAYRTDFTSQVVVDVDHSPQSVEIYNLKGPSYSNTAQFEFNAEPRKRLFIKTAYRFVDTKVSLTKGLIQKAMVSQHRAFVNTSYETRNGHWQIDATLQYNGAKRLPSTAGNPSDYVRANYSPDFYNVLSQITYLTKVKGHDFHLYLGVENLLNYKQRNPILASANPYSPYFDASMVWGPVYGRMTYAGLRFKIK